MNLYVLFDKMRSQFYKYPLAIKLNIPLMPIFMVLSTHPLGATSNSSPRLQKKRKTNDSMHWHYGFSPVMNSCHIIYISVSKTSQMKIFFRKRMKSNVSSICPRHLFCSFPLYWIYEVVMLLIVITFTEPGNHPQSLHSKLFQRILYSDSKQNTYKIICIFDYLGMQCVLKKSLVVCLNGIYSVIVKTLNNMLWTKRSNRSFLS